MDYIKHHGILGQKWGIRRYQNPDGTRTFEGKKRDRLSNKENKQASDDYLNAHSGKSMEELSTKELQAVVNRLNFEQQYKNLEKSKVSKGRKVVGNILSDTSTLAIAAVPIAALVAKSKGVDVTKTTAVVSAVAALTKVVGDIIKR